MGPKEGKKPQERPGRIMDCIATIRAIFICIAYRYRLTHYQCHLSYGGDQLSLLCAFPSLTHASHFRVQIWYQEGFKKLRGLDNKVIHHLTNVVIERHDIGDMLIVTCGSPSSIMLDTGLNVIQDLAEAGKKMSNYAGRLYVDPLHASVLLDINTDDLQLAVDDEQQKIQHRD